MKLKAPLRFLIVFEILVNLGIVNKAQFVTDNSKFYSLSVSRKNWTAASDDCRSQGYRILTVVSSEEQSIALNLTSGITTYLWLGLYQYTLPWQWLDGKVLYRQGCYVDDPVYKDFSGSPIIIPGKTDILEQCGQVCHNSDFKYAGLQIGSNICYCGNTFGKYGQCSSQSSSGNQVLAVDGSYSDWLVDQPNNYNSYQTVATIEVLLSGGVATVAWNDASSYELFQALCTVPSDACTSNPVNNDATKTWYNNNTDHCYVVLAMPQYSWFNARTACLRLNGDLAIIEDKHEMDFLTPKFTQKSIAENRSDEQYWVGLMRTEWRWVSGETLNYTNWRVLGDPQPNSQQQACAAIDMSTKSYPWDNLPCNTELYYICKNDPHWVDITTTQTSSVRSTGTTSPQLTSPNPTDKNKLQDVDYALIAGLLSGLLVIILIAVPVTCCVYRHQEKRRKKIEEEEKKEKYFFGIEIKDEPAPLQLLPPRRVKYAGSKQQTPGLDNNLSLTPGVYAVPVDVHVNDVRDQAVNHMDMSEFTSKYGQVTTGREQGVEPMEIPGGPPDLLSDILVY